MPDRQLRSSYIELMRILLLVANDIYSLSHDGSRVFCESLFFKIYDEEN